MSSRGELTADKLTTFSRTFGRRSRTVPHLLRVGNRLKEGYKSKKKVKKGVGVEVLKAFKAP